MDSAAAAADLRQRVLDATGKSLGDFIAELDIPAEVKVRQQGADLHHYLVWRSAEVLIGYITNIAAALPLEPTEPQEEPE